MRAGRFPAPTGDPRKDAIDQLRWSMGGAGLTVGKVPHMAAVLALPQVAAAVAAVPAPAGPAAALDAVVAAARGLGQGVQARLLRSSLGVDYDGGGRNLTARRAEFLAAHNAAARANGSRAFVGDSPRAAYDVEAEMLGALVTALGAPPGVTARPAMPSGNPWHTVEFDVTYRLRGHAGAEAEVTQVLVADADGVEGYELPYWCGNDDGGPARLVVYEGGEVTEDRSYGRPGYRVGKIRYPAPLRAGQRHRIRYDTQYPGSDNPDDWFALTIGGAVERATVRVTFDPAAIPCRVWRLDGEPIETGSGEPDESEPLVLDPTGHVATSFTAPPPGFRYGVAWAWPE